MQFKFRYSALLAKSGKTKSGRVPITIVPNKPTEDRQNDTIVLKAFEDCREEFLKEGVIDWDHISVLGKSALEKSQAIIGAPEDLYVSDHLPYCDAYLFEKNPYVHDVLMPALEAETTVFGASVGGKVLQKSSSTDVKTNTKHSTITRIKLKHIAICPLQKAVHPGTSISLRKSGESEEYVFNGFNELVKSFNDEEYLIKTMIANEGVTDSAQLSGGASLQNQSLEGVNYKLIKKAMPIVLLAVSSGQLSGNYDSIKKKLMKTGLNKKEADKMTKLIAVNGDKIVKNFKQKGKR
jgi:hypothetical protein